MKTKMPARKWLQFAAAACVCCALRLPAQTPPTITTQPVSQTNLAGTTVAFPVAISGTGPFACQWQLNGANLQNGIITTVAGYGTNSFGGDGAVATEAGLNDPTGAAFDAFGNLYIADGQNFRIRKVDTNGIITTVAGNGLPAFAGDGGPATQASLSCGGVAVDAAGNLYIGDYYNSRVRKVNTNGIITTFAGTNIGGVSGDGGPAVNATLVPFGVAFDGSGNLYITDLYYNRIRRVDTNGIITTVAGTNSQGFSGDGGPAVNASLYRPNAVALDAVGNIYIADMYNNRIRRVATNGIITTVAGTNSQGYSGDGGAATYAELHYPSGVAVDAFGDLYIADFINARMVATNGIITTVAGGKPSGGDGNPATNAYVSPYGVALDASGNLYIAAAQDDRIREVFLYAGYPALTLYNVGASNAGSYTVVVSNSYGSVTSAVATLTVLGPPAFIDPPVNQWILAGSNATLNATVSGTAPLWYSWYYNATNLVQSSANSALAVQDVSANNAGSYTVVVTNIYGSVTSQVALLTAGYPPTVTMPPGGQTVLPGNNVNFSVAVGGTGPFSWQWQFNGANLPNNIITTAAGTNAEGYSGDSGPASKAELYWPCGLRSDAWGNLYIADTFNDRIRKVDTNGIITTVAGIGLLPYSISGNLSGDGTPATNAALYHPAYVAFDAFGNMYIADNGNGRVRKVDTKGIISIIAGNDSTGFGGDGGPATQASLYNPTSVAFDAAGDLYIADMLNNRIRKVDTNGIITTVAGIGDELGPPFSVGSFSGDGGPARKAGLNWPCGVTFDALGNLYIADSSNNRIRKVDTNGIITTFAGTNHWGYSGDGGLAVNAELFGPGGVAVDALGNMYISDSGNNRIRKVDTNGIITTVAGTNGVGFSGDGGPATNALLDCPDGLILDSSGNLYIADMTNNRIREVHFGGFPALPLTNVSASNAGSYAVVVTSPYGSVTSAVATLIVQAPPVITIQPSNETVLAGSSPVFPVTVAGTGPFGYAWYLAVTNLVQSGTNSALTLPCVYTNNAGSYTVVVTNAYGSVTSAVATLTVTIPTTPPQIITSDGFCGFLTNHFGFNLCGAFGQTIVVDGSADLVNWTPLITNICGSGNPFYFCDPCWTNYPWRFYRARLQ